MIDIKTTSVQILWYLVAVGLLLFAVSFNIFVSLDQSEKPVSSDVIIVVEGSVPDRAYQGVQLLTEGYADSDRLIVSPVTERNLPYYFLAGATREELIFEENATSTWTNAINTITIMEENGWDSAIVVTTDYHTRRTRLSFERAAREKEIDFTYVSAYQKVEEEPVRYLEHGTGMKIGLRETVKYLGYLFGLYHIFDL